MKENFFQTLNDELYNHIVLRHSTYFPLIYSSVPLKKIYIYLYIHIYIFRSVPTFYGNHFVYLEAMNLKKNFSLANFRI